MTEIGYVGWIGTDGDMTVQYMVYLAAAIILAFAVVAVYLFWRLFVKYVLHKKASKKSLAVIIPLVLFVFYLFFIQPSMSRDMQWRALQYKCAKQAGYQTPQDDNNMQIATYETQDAYRRCLNIDDAWRTP